MPRERREYRMRGRYRLRRIRDDYTDEEIGQETVIEYSTGSDTDDDDEPQQPRRKFHVKPRRMAPCGIMIRSKICRSFRDLILVLLITVWLIENMTENQKHQLSTWQQWLATWWDLKAVPSVRNITTETVAGLKRFHNRHAPRTDGQTHLPPTSIKASTFPVAS